ncbi:hypothetical protein [Streptomyces sp. NBC_01353]|uniref:hypothetical protein n=1 Tax=Streptomyces sp. NBC_01353 TaxID=2903835 RepID=UPI002E33DEDB|nr:hypothetical protein [Streptomyces sp. NBC_01353]
MLAFFFACAEQRSLFSFVLYILLGFCGVMQCYVETRKLIRSEETTKAALDRLEAAEAGESPS